MFGFSNAPGIFSGIQHQLRVFAAFLDFLHIFGMLQKQHFLDDGLFYKNKMGMDEQRIASVARCKQKKKARTARSRPSSASCARSGAPPARSGIRRESPVRAVRFLCDDGSSRTVLAALALGILWTIDLRQLSK